MNIDTTINLGHVIMVVLGAAAAIGTVYMMKTDIRIVNVRIEGIEKVLTAIQIELKAMGQVFINQALNDQKMRELVRRMEHIEARESGRNSQ